MRESSTRAKNKDKEYKLTIGVHKTHQNNLKDVINIQDFLKEISFKD